MPDLAKLFRVILNMRNFILLFTFIVTIISCSDNKHEDSNQKVVRIDTTTTKNEYSFSDQSITISKKNDGVEVERTEESVDSTGRLWKRFCYNDSVGTLKYSYENKYLELSDEVYNIIVNTWYNSPGRPILSFDSTFTKNKLTSVNCNLFDERGLHKFSYHIEYRFGKVNGIRIGDNDFNREYLSNNNGFWEMDSDVSLKYREWVSSTKLAFGKVHQRFIDAFITSYSEVESHYRDLAENKHGFNYWNMYNLITK